MRKGLAISLAFHAAILFWAVAAFPSARDLDSLDKQPVPVEVVTPSEISQVKAGKKDAKKEKPAAKKPDKPAETPKMAKNETKRPKRLSPPAPKPAAVKAPAEPAPKPLAKKAQPKPEKKPEKVARKAPPPMPSRRPAKAPKNSRPLKPERKVAARAAKAKKSFDPDRISALLNKQPDAAAAPSRAPAPDRKPTRVAKGTARGHDAQMTLSEIDALRQRISQCWNPPVGGLGADSIRVKLRLQLSPDGMLSERPQVVNREGSPFFQAAADSAVRAVMLCQPYALPGAKYALWRDMILNFDPREMYGG
jgi:hypothetical protein